MTVISHYFDLLIIDDIVPSTFSPFRTIEYSHYLRFFDATILSLEGWNLWIENQSFEQARDKFPVSEELKARILKFGADHNVVAKLAYITFLGNAYRLLPYLQDRNMPFILQLYPGGGFAVGQDDVDIQLRDVLRSRLCRKVITTQTITKDYILSDRIGCDPAKVEFIFGGVFESDIPFEFFRDKKLYGKGKATRDICFVAHKYGDDLTSKGYDYFVSLAKRLVPLVHDLRFHVVGDYTREDIPLEIADSAFTFYGRRPSEFFSTFYPSMDAIISFNRAFVLKPGAFDGFPTGSCLEAGFWGVANVINDPLHLNVAFEDGKDIMLLGDDFEKSVTAVAELLLDTEGVSQLGYATHQAYMSAMGRESQLWARTRVITRELLVERPYLMTRTASISSLDGESVRRATENLRHHNSVLARELTLVQARAEELSRELGLYQSRVIELSRSFSNRLLARLKVWAKRILGRG